MYPPPHMTHTIPGMTHMMPRMHVKGGLSPSVSALGGGEWGVLGVGGMGVGVGRGGESPRAGRRGGGGSLSPVTSPRQRTYAALSSASPRSMLAGWGGGLSDGGRYRNGGAGVRGGGVDDSSLYASRRAGLVAIGPGIMEVSQSVRAHSYDDDLVGPTPVAGGACPTVYIIYICIYI